MMQDIFEGIMRISHEFRAAGYKSPPIIHLADHEDGMRLLCDLHQKNHIMVPLGSKAGGKPVIGSDGAVWMEVEIYGAKVRWPANQIALENGSNPYY